MTEPLEHWRRWIGRSQEDSDVIDVLRARAMQATSSNDTAAPLVAGDPLPPLWHWLYFWSTEPHLSLGPDGHAARGGQFLPPINLPRRMWAGGSFTFVKPLTIGAPATRRSTITDITRKQGSSGQLAFVKVEHEISDDQGPCLKEIQDIVFRQAPRPGEAPEPGEAAPAVLPWRNKVTPDPVLLFRYSALTFNGHRIHYDLNYATEEEGYPGLVVHGPAPGHPDDGPGLREAAGPPDHEFHLSGFAPRLRHGALLGRRAQWPGRQSAPSSGSPTPTAPSPCRPAPTWPEPHLSA